MSQVRILSFRPKTTKLTFVSVWWFLLWIRSRLSSCEHASALALGERAKTVDDCFCDAKSTKQRVSAFECTEKVETTMRLDRRRSRRCRRNYNLLSGCMRRSAHLYYISGCMRDGKLQATFGSALALKARCRRFESCHSDQNCRFDCF